uniref:SPX domain-containing protein n=1 Tax=Nelumbo nucifera TaxID=4432 RepID=A0A822YQW6_NELNU|nr:TPA_asm: hypothetical protein HUJ06_005570 [Nelumbo nucifera]
MKFGKEFTSHIVPEWQEAYIDYNYLKTRLKEILRFKQRNNPPATAAPASDLKRKMSLYRAFSGLTQKYQSFKNPTSRGGDIEDQVIFVSSVQEEGSEERRYETNFLMSSDEGSEYELDFFRRLDDELNKVNKFYKSKVDEVLEEADMLNKQMSALIAFRIKVENPTLELNWIFKNPNSNSNRGIPENSQNSIKASSRPAPLEVLKHVKMNNTLETPSSTLKGFLNSKVHNSTELSFRKKDLKKVEEQLKRAFVEFYQKLRLLKSYSFLKILAFSKIMKKYDKKCIKNYLKVVDNSYIGNSDEVTNPT